MISKFIDERGEITNILSGELIQGVSLIFSKKGSIRSNHYHAKDVHWLHVISGEMMYEEQMLPLNKNEKKTFIIGKGSMIKTSPMVAHRTTFTEDTVLLCLSTLPKDHDHDMIKVEF